MNRHCRYIMSCEIVAAALLVLICMSSTEGKRIYDYHLGSRENALLKAQHKQAYVTVRGRYSNYDYAYSVFVPKGMVGLRSPAPNPNHGFVIRLRGEAKAELSVDASYNAAEWDSFDEALNADLDRFKRETGSEVSILTRRFVVLGGLKAIHFALHSEISVANEPMIRDVILAFRNDPGGVGIVYEIALTTPARRYERDRQLVTQLQKSFRLKALPK
jgi:hypothetical protein